MLLFTRPLPKLNVSAAAFEQAEIDAVGVATTDIVYVRTESDAARPGAAAGVAALYP